LIEAYQIRPEIPYGVSRVLYAAMALSAEQRPATAKEMRAMLADAKTEEAPADAQTFTDNSPRTNIYSQKTKVYGDSSRVSRLKQSDVKTETLPTHESKVTQLKPRVVTGDFAENETKIQPLVGATTAANDQKSRRGLVMGAALGSLLLLAIGAFATYIFKPEVFNTHQPAAGTEPDKKMIMVQVPTENANIADATTETANVNAITVVPVQPANVAVPAETKSKDAVVKTETKPAETKAKTETFAPKNDTVSVDDPPDIEVDADDNDDATGEPPTNPRTKQKFPIQVWRKMTPQERRKLREALEMNRQLQMDKRQLEIQRRNMPKPPQTPNQ
jgi:hypothetical protein